MFMFLTPVISEGMATIMYNCAIYIKSLSKNI